MIRKYHNHKLQTTPWHREEEPLNHHETPGRQIKQSNQLSLPHQDEKVCTNGTQYKDRKWGAGVESTRFTVLLVVNRFERILLLTIFYCWTKAILKSLGQFKNLVFVIIPTREIYALSLELLSPFVYRWSLICALWSPAGKGLTSWLSFVVSTVSLSLSHWYPGSGMVLDCIDSWYLHPYLLPSGLIRWTWDSLLYISRVSGCNSQKRKEKQSVFFFLRIFLPSEAV